MGSRETAPICSGYVESDAINFIDPEGFGKQKGNQRLTTYENTSTEALKARAKDKSLSKKEKREVQRELKARGERNKDKVRGKGKGLRAGRGAGVAIFGYNCTSSLDCICVNYPDQCPLPPDDGAETNCEDDPE